MTEVPPPTFVSIQFPLNRQSVAGALATVPALAPPPTIAAAPVLVLLPEPIEHKTTKPLLPGRTPSPTQDIHSTDRLDDSSFDGNLQKPRKSSQPPFCCAQVEQKLALESQVSEQQRQSCFLRTKRNI